MADRKDIKCKVCGEAVGHGYLYERSRIMAEHYIKEHTEEFLELGKVYDEVYVLCRKLNIATNDIFILNVARRYGIRSGQVEALEGVNDVEEKKSS